MNRSKPPQRNKKKVESNKQLERPSNHKPKFQEWFWKKRTQIIIISIVIPVIAIVVPVVMFLCQKSTDNRAYISVIEPFFYEPYIFAGNDGFPFEATFTIICNGLVDEIRDSSYAEILPKDPELLMPKGVDQSRQLVCSPNSPQVRTVQAAKVPSKEQVAGFLNREMKLYLWGRIAYKAAGKSHEMRFCFEYDIDQRKFKPYDDCNRIVE